MWTLLEGIFLMADEERKKRNVAFERKINTISKDDIRVKVVGTIVEKDAATNSIVIDDGESKVRVLLDENIFTVLELGKLVRTIGIIAPALQGEDFELKGEIVQDFSGLDKELYQQYISAKPSLQ
jgi:hypothetical protein